MRHPVPFGAPRPWRGRTVALLGVVLAALNLRIAVASVSPVLDVVSAEVPFTPGEAGLLGSVPVVAFAVFGALGPALGRRLGLERALVAAMLLSTAGEVLRSTTTTAPGFLAWSVVALAGMGLGNVLVPPLVKRYFPDRLGAVTAVYSMVMAVSTAVPPLVAVPLTEALGWRMSLGSWSVVGIAAALPWVVVALRDRARADAGAAADGAPPVHPDGRVWRSPLAWALGATFAMNTLHVYVLFAWLPSILSDAGQDAASAGRWLALFAVLGFPCALVVPPLVVRLRNPWPIMVVFVVLFVAGYLGLWLSPDRLLGLWVVLLGVAPGGFPLLLTLANLRTRTSAGASSLSGFMQGVGYGIAGAGPVVVGLLHERTGSWTPAFVLLLGSVAVLLVASWFACRPVWLEDTWAPRARLATGP